MSNSVFLVDARIHSVAGGPGLSTGLSLSPGQIVMISSDPSDTWSAGVADRISNANGLGNPLGGNYGLHSRGDFSFLFGSLVGSLDNGKTFFGVGTQLCMTLVTKGTLNLYYWDSNMADNSGKVRVTVQIFEGPTNVSPM